MSVSKRSPIILRGWRGFLLLAALFFLLLRIRSRQVKMSSINEIGRDVYLLLIEHGFSISQSQYITAQAAHETANFSSPVFIQNNNLFGYGYRGQKIAIGEKNGYANYKSIADSIKDFKTYYSLRGYPRQFNSVSEYVKTLKRNGYFEAPEQEYLTGVKHFLNLYFGGK